MDAADRARLEAIVADRNSPQKHVWRARIVLLAVPEAELADTDLPNREAAAQDTALDHVLLSQHIQ